MKLSNFRRRGRDDRTELSGGTAEGADTVEQSSEAVQELGEENTASPFVEKRLKPLPDDRSLRPSALDIARIVLAVALVLLSVFLKTLPEAAVIAIRAVAALGVGYDVILSAVRDWRVSNLYRDGLPVVFASLLAFVNGMSLEGAIAMTILQISLCLRDYAFCKTRDLILETVSLPKEPSSLAIGDSFAIESGQMVPAGCVIIQGTVTADLSFVCGERSEKTLKAGDRLPAGSLCLGGSAMAEVTELPEETAAYAIEKTLESGYAAVTRTERRITEFSKYLTYLILLAGLVLIVALPLATDLTFGESLRRFAAVIAMASPCGVLVSIPLIYLASMAEQRRQGTVFFSSSNMDSASYTKAVVFDKSGTVTADTYEVVDAFSDRMDPRTFLKVAAHAAYGSSNPLAAAIVKAYGEPVSGDFISGFAEYPGWGVSVTVEGIQILLGTGSFMERNQLQPIRVSGEDNVIYMAVGGIIAGRISLHDSVNPAMRDAVAELTKLGADRIAMVSGDGRERDSGVAAEIGVSEYFAECSDEAKAQSIKELRKRVDAKGSIAYVCANRGSRDACRAADLAVVMASTDVNALGGDADALILSRSVGSVPQALLAAKRTRRMAVFGTATGFLLKLVIVAFACAGIVPLWFSVLFDACISLSLIVASYSISKTKA